MASISACITRLCSLSLRVVKPFGLRDVERDPRGQSARREILAFDRVCGLRRLISKLVARARSEKQENRNRQQDYERDRKAPGQIVETFNSHCASRTFPSATRLGPSVEAFIGRREAT